MKSKLNVPVHKINLVRKHLGFEPSKQSIDKRKQVEEKVVKDYRISRKAFDNICYILMAISLIAVMIYANYERKVYETFDTVEELTITYSDNTTFDITTDNNTTLLYWYGDSSNLDIETLISFADEKLNIIVLTTGSVFETIEYTLDEYNIHFAVDDNEKLLKQFSKKVSYPYSVYLDFNDKVLINQNNMISDTEYFEIIHNTLLGLTVGNEVGNICINKDIGLVGKDDTFSVAKNRGKVTIINFWYTTCTPCVQELPHFNSLYEEYSDYVSVIAIHEASGYMNNPEGVKKFIDTQFEGFSIMFGYDDPNDSYYTKLGGLKAWPVTVIVDQEGIVVNVVHGSMTETELRAQIEKLIK